MHTPLAAARYAAETERPLRLIRLPQLLDLTALSRSAVYRLVREDPTFPRPVKLGARSVAWNFHSVQKWIADRIAQRDAKAGAA